MRTLQLLAIPFVPVFYLIIQRLIERRRPPESTGKPPKDKVAAKPEQ